MDFIEKILSEISRTQEIVEGWKNLDEIPTIERKIVKNHLANIYDELSATKPVAQKQEAEKIEKTEVKKVEAETEKPVVEKPVPHVEKIVEEAVVEKTVAAEKVANETPQQHQYAHAILGETLQKTKRFLSDDFGEKEDTLLPPIADLSKGIGLNDKFLFAKELFDGKAQQFEKTVITINSMNSFDEALQYIRDNFSWQENNSVVKHFITLVRRRFM
jgi:hypothetical protein